MAPAIQQKTCRTCKRTLLVAEFERRAKGSVDGYRGECRDCRTSRRYGKARLPKNYRVVDGVKLKACTRCKIEMEATLENFQSKARGGFGLDARCRGCASQTVMESRKEHDPTFERVRAWTKANRERHNEYAKRTRASRSGKRLEAHREWRRDHERKRRLDPQYRLLQSVRAQINMVVRDKFDGGGLLRRLGYSRADLIAHIERQFERGMTWANYGGNGRKGGWELDHRIPCAAFDMTDDEQFRQCWALSNLRPLWSEKNRSKGKRMELLV